MARRSTNSKSAALRSGIIAAILAALLPLMTAAGPSPGQRDVSFTSGAARLDGTVLLPAGEGPAPAVVMLPGGGGWERRELVPFGERYRARGFVVLLFDQRGAGTSSGIWENLLTDRAIDTVAAIRWLERQPEVDADRIGAWGVSQAGWVIPVALGRIDAAFAVVISGGGAGPRESEMWAYRNALSHRGFELDSLPAAQRLLNRYFDYLATGAGHSRVLQLIESLRAEPWYAAVAVDRILPAPERRGVWSWVATHDPGPYIRSLETPVLCLIGSLDTQQPPARAAELWRNGLAASAVAGSSRVVEFAAAGHGITLGTHHDAADENVHAEGYWDTQFEWLEALGIIR